MKTIKFFLAICISILFISDLAVQAQSSVRQEPSSVKTESFKVWGNCDMCKTRIEKAAKAGGVSSAEWSTKTKLLTVSFDPSKTNLDALSKKMASAGHDTEKYRADDKVYNSLPACCKYERAK